jgi:2,3-bisphosphoglycerate-dependent phosphoglycerate mutase
MSTLVLLRHGESEWNALNLFTGWTDVPLSSKGREEAREAGRLLAQAGIAPDVVHTSLLKRAIVTANIALDALDRAWLPVRRSWRLNERHYGALQGLDKQQTSLRHGKEQVFVWRRSYDVPPPAIDDADERHPRHDRRYAELAPDALPATECLKDVVVRMLPYWHDTIVPDLRAGKVVLVAAHGNSIRALIKHLDGIADDAIAELNVPTGIPRVYQLDQALRAIASRYLGDADLVAKAVDAVQKQAG